MCCALLSAACQPAALSEAQAARPSGLAMSVEPYFDYFKYGEWLPLRVTLANDGPAVKAELQVNMAVTGVYMVYAAPVDLPSGARKRVTLYVQLPSFAKAVHVRLMAGERELASQIVDVTLVRNVDYVVGVIAPRSEPFMMLSGLTLEGSQDNRARAVRPIPMALADIPERPEGLRVLDALVISGVDTSGLSPQQGRALQGWVEQGGRLILGGGASATRSQAGLPGALLAGLARPGVVVELESLETLGEFASQPVQVPGPYVVTWLDGSLGGTEPMPEGSEALVVQEGHALLLDRRLGQGYVSYAALDLAGSPFDAWAGGSLFWRRLLERGSSYSRDAPPDVAPRLVHARSMSQVLRGLPNLRLPPVGGLAGLLGAYILLVGPLNRLVLRKMRRLEWGWVTIPAVTVLFSTGAFALGDYLRGDAVIVSQLSVCVLGVPDTAAPVQTLVGVFSPVRRAYTLDLPADALASHLEDGVTWDSKMVQGSRPQVRGLKIGQGAMQSFVVESPPPAGWEIESSLIFEDGWVRGALVNRTGQPIVDAVLVRDGRMMPVGDLPAGQSVRLNSKRVGNISSLLTFLSERRPSLHASRLQEQIEGYYRDLPPGQAVLIGWMESSPIDVQINGVRLSREKISLIVAALE
ncbi:MAG: hypothetical protein JW850_09840 [Thermoflexales bacterium]|nr:hypothetical protein [Thermoflexales bacterium]